MRFTIVIGETTGDMSCDDHIFFRLMDQETVQVDNHGKFQLPFKSTDVTFPSNTSAALKMLNSSKGRSIRDSLFHEMYKTFIDDMLQKGYARKAENKQVGRVWYLPHHGVAYPAKEGNARFQRAYCRTRVNKSAGWCIDQVQRGTHCIYD